MRTHTDTAVILAAGRGLRMRRRAAGDSNLPAETRKLALKGLKGLIPVGGRPFLDYSIRRLINAGIKHVCFVLSNEAAELREYGKRAAKEFGVAVDYAIQEEPKGTADAVLCCERVVGSKDFLLCNCDNLYPQNALAQLTAVKPNVWAVAGFDSDVLLRESNFEANRIGSFAVLKLDGRGRLLDILEKPANPSEYDYRGKVWVSMNLYRFTPRVFDFCRRIEPHPDRGELELTAAVSRMLRDRADTCSIILASGAVFDMTNIKDIAPVERSLAAGAETEGGDA